jgi:16S rRNA (guanine966-N2)-methyltransferase
MLTANPDRPFEFIYIAPPQYKGMWSRALLALDANPGWLTETGWAIVQIDPKEFQELELNVLEELDQRRYGSTLLVFYGLKET